MTTPPAPLEFPIPPDVEGFWSWEKGHFPRPATPLTQEIVYGALSAGFSRAMHDWACPFGVACRAINYYGFLALKPFDRGTETVEDRAPAIRRASARSCRAWEHCGSRNGSQRSSPASRGPHCRRHRREQRGAVAHVGRHAAGFSRPLDGPWVGELRDHRCQLVRRLLYRDVRARRPHRAVSVPAGLPHALPRRWPWLVAAQSAHQDASRAHEGV